MSQTQKNIDEVFMQRCLQLAILGLGKVSTNPLVGCVIVYDGTIVGEGYHQKFGEAHAEVNAINSISGKSILSKCTLYVNLEPCAHHGKTPPCADLIVKHKIKRVVIGTIDTFSKVAGKGIERLKNTGIDVETGVLEKECRDLNRRFFCFNEKQRPYIILKWAETSDGFIGRIEEDRGLSKRISNIYTDVEVHQWRTEEDAILVGTNTALLDNPSLTARNWIGDNPIRVLIDYDLRIPPHYHIYNSEAKTIIINSIRSGDEGNIVFEKVGSKNLKTVLDVLYKYKIQSIIIEGGAMVLQSFIDEHLWDEARVIKSLKLWGDGVKSPMVEGKLIGKIEIEGDDVLTLYA